MTWYSENQPQEQIWKVYTLNSWKCTNIVKPVLKLGKQTSVSWSIWCTLILECKQLRVYPRYDYSFFQKLKKRCIVRFLYFLAFLSSFCSNRHWKGCLDVFVEKPDTFFPMDSAFVGWKSLLWNYSFVTLRKCVEQFTRFNNENYDNY